MTMDLRGAEEEAGRWDTRRRVRGGTMRGRRGETMTRGRGDDAGLED
ncbi:MAG: hypothetical protein LBT40_07760 [Deltaproteobacteria bacterium]|jgi:hypothetical protein|nr:hypothetical protein [Deltaproteobacteria bacterium]